MTDISVLLPVRDWDLTRVDMCLRSLRAPNDYQVEIVVVDYGSGDARGIRDLALSHGCTFERVEAAEWSRSNAMNTAARISSGRNLMFADADLVFAPSVLPCTIRKLDESPNSVLMFQVRDLPSTITPSELLAPPDFDYLESQAVWRPRWGMGIQAHTRRSFDFIRGFDDRMKIYGGEDNDLAKRARGNGYRLEWTNSPDFGTYHVWHPSSRQAADADPATRAALEKNAEIAKTDNSIVRNLASWRGKDPLVSVVIATFNRAEYLAQSITSVLNQSFQDFELVIMDDGSTDDTRAVVEALDDGRITYCREERSGIPALRNQALKVSRGRYTAIHDDDDIMLPWSLESRLTSLRPGVSGAYGGAFDFDDESGAMTLFPGREAELSSVVEGAKVFYHATLLVETEALRAVRYDEAFPSGSDFNLAIRLMKIGFRLAHCGDIVLLRRLHGEQVTVRDQGIQHGASYATSFSQRATWSPIGRRRSRDRSKELGPYPYDPMVVSESRVRPYLPDHLVRRSALIATPATDPLPQDAIRGEIVGSDGTFSVAFVPEATAAQVAAVRQHSEAFSSVHAHMRAARHSTAHVLQEMVHDVLGGKEFVTVNPHLLEHGFVVVAREDVAQLREFLDPMEERCYFVMLSADLNMARLFLELARSASDSPFVESQSDLGLSAVQ